MIKLVTNRKHTDYISISIWPLIKIFKATVKRAQETIMHATVVKPNIHYALAESIHRLSRITKDSKFKINYFIEC